MPPETVSVWATHHASSLFASERPLPAAHIAAWRCRHDERDALRRVASMPARRSFRRPRIETHLQPTRPPSMQPPCGRSFGGHSGNARGQPSCCVSAVISSNLCAQPLRRGQGPPHCNRDGRRDLCPSRQMITALCSQQNASPALPDSARPLLFRNQGRQNCCVRGFIAQGCVENRPEPLHGLYFFSYRLLRTDTTTPAPRP